MYLRGLNTDSSHIWLTYQCTVVSFLINNYHTPIWFILSLYSNKFKLFKISQDFSAFFKLTCHYEVGRELAADYTPGQVPPLLLTENNIIHLHKYIQVNKIHSSLTFFSISDRTWKTSQMCVLHLISKFYRYKTGSCISLVWKID